MFRLSRLAALPVLLLLCYSLASAQPPLPPRVLVWATYLSKDMKTDVPQPEWVEAPLPAGKVWLKIGQAIYTPPMGLHAGKAKLFVRVAGPQPGTWIDPPALTLDAKVSLVGGPQNKHDFVVQDKDTPPKEFVSGSTVQLQFQITLNKDADNSKLTFILPPDMRDTTEK